MYVPAVMVLPLISKLQADKSVIIYSNRSGVSIGTHSIITLAILAHPMTHTVCNHFRDKADRKIFSLPNKVIFRHISIDSSAGIIWR